MTAQRAQHTLTDAEHRLEVLDPAMRHLLPPQDWCDVCDCPQDVVATSLEDNLPGDLDLNPFSASGTLEVFQLACGHVITCPLRDDTSVLWGADPYDDYDDLFAGEPFDTPADPKGLR